MHASPIVMELVSHMWDNWYEIHGEKAAIWWKGCHISPF